MGSDSCAAGAVSDVNTRVLGSKTSGVEMTSTASLTVHAPPGQSRSLCQICPAFVPPKQRRFDPATVTTRPSPSVVDVGYHRRNAI